MEFLHSPPWTRPTEGKLHYWGIKFGSRLLLVCIFVFKSTSLALFFFRFVAFQRVLDAEMKEAMRMGVTLKRKGNKKLIKRP